MVEYKESIFKRILNKIKCISYIASVGSRIKGTGCPYCAGQKVLEGYNDLATTNPELLEEWDYQKNTIKSNYVCYLNQ